MVFLGFPLLRMSSRPGVEPMEDSVLPPAIQAPGNPTSGVSFLNTPSTVHHITMACLYTLIVFYQSRKWTVKINTRVVVESLLLFALAQCFSSLVDITDSLWGFLLTMTVLGYIHCSLPSEYLDVENKAVLVTGCDRGFGHALAIRLDQLGFRVYAGCLDKTGPGALKLERECSERLKAIQLDVTKDVDVELAAERVKADLGETKLWGIVNNAGICMAGNTEIMSVDDMQKIMDVNFWGPVRVCKAFLPMVRQGRGRVVNVASNAGLAPVRLMGAYCASKAAVATMTEVWRAELEAWGVKVSTIVPSGFNTGILAYDKNKMAEKWYDMASEVVKKDFGKDAFYVRPAAEGKEEKLLSSDLSPITDVMIDALLSTSPKSYYHRGMLARSLPFLFAHLPCALGEPLMKVLADWFHSATPQALKES